MANLLINTTVGGNAVITTSNIGTYALTSITSGNVTTALGYTPYNATNPSGYITSSALSSYLPLTGGALTGGLYINNADPTIFLQDTNHRSAMIHVNSNVFYVLRGTGTNSTGWSTYNGYWPLELNLENNNAIFGGSVSAPVGDFRAPIFYDSQNTAYYLDPNSTSNLNVVNLSTLNSTDTNARYYYQSTNGVPSNNLGNPTVTEMALFDEQFNNKTAFYNPASLSFWTSSDGTNYTEYTGFDTTIKKRFLGGDSDSGVYIPNLTNRFRIEVENSAGYVFLNQLYIYWSSNSHSTKVHIWVRRCDNNQWYQWTDSNQYVSSWPGHLYLPFGGIPFYPGYLDSTGHYNRIRIEFIPSWAGGTYSYTGINLMRMQIWGGYPAGKRNIYSTDENQNVSFPAIISATTFSGALSGNATTASALTSMNISQFTNNSGYITGYTETDTLASVTGRGATTASQVSFTQTGDHAISVGTIRGRAVGVQTGEFIQLYERVNIGGPNGWGASNTSAPSYGLSVYGGATIGYGNSGGLSVTGVLRIASSDNLYLDTNYGQSIVGVYSASRYQGVFAMGDSYKLSVDGTSAGSLYGLAWTHTNVGGESKSGLSHQLLIMHNGSTQTAIGTGIWTSGLITTTSYGTSANWNTAFGWGNHASAGYLTGITSGQVTGALGYTPYNSSNPSGYITSSGSISGNAGTVTNGVYTNSSSAISGDNHMTFGPNSTWSSYIRVGGNGRTVSGDAYASMVTTNGNLHLDGGNTRAIYLNYYAGTSGTAFGNGATGVVAWMGSDGDLWKGSSDNSGTQYVYNSGTWSINVTGSAGSAGQVTHNASRTDSTFYNVGWFSGNPSPAYSCDAVQIQSSTGTLKATYVNAPSGYVSNGNPWSTANSAFFPNGITTAGNDNWIYGHTYVGNAPGNGAGHEFWSDGSEFHKASVGTASQGQSGKWITLQSANGNFIPYSFESDRGNHSWGTVARYRINNGESDRPSIQFSWGGSDTRWNVGYCYADDLFRITQNMGYRNDNSTSDGWGTERFKIDTSGNTYAAIGGTLYANGNAVITSANIGSQSVSYASSAGSLTSMNISQFTNNSGYITGISFANVSSKPTTISGYGITDAITTANIGSQSVSYAATAGSAPNGGNINSNYDVAAGVGNGLRFWNGSSAYKISMGVGSLYQYGPVTDYSIKAQMNDSDAGRGFTWGRESYAPIAALNSTSGDMEIAGYFKSYGYRSNSNVGGTGSASWHPDGIYCGSTMWQYGSLYKNNTGIYGVSEMTMSSGPILSTYNTRNLIVRALDNNADVGILGQKSGGGFAFQIYGTGTSYGFLNGTWAAWDIRKAINGAMYMNDNDSYYLQTNSTSNFYALNIQGSAVVHAGNIGSQSVSYASSAGSAGSVSGLTLTSSANGINPNSVTQNQIGYNTSVSLFGQTDGGLYSSAYSSDWIHQIYGDFRTGQIAIRGKNAGSWQAWRTVLDSSNYTSYAPSLTGSGASGTWSINVTGSAGSAGSVAWTNVSSRPTALSQFSNDLGNYGGFLTSITAHTHAISDVTGLQTALDGKQASGSYAASSHTHDDRYYTESESDTRFARKDTDAAISGNLVIGNGTYGNSTAYGNSGARLMFSGSDGDAQGNYYIGTNHNDYGGNYSKLELRWHTGIRMGAQPGYGGIRFYDTEDLGTVIFSVGTGDSHVRVVNNLYVGGNLALHAGNYNSYSPTLTGTGASGTWSISVSGNAATATNVAYSGLTGTVPTWNQNTTGSAGSVGGYAVSGSVGANTVVIRDGNGYIYAHYINSNVSETENPTINSFYTSNGDGWLRKSSVAHVKSQLGLGSMAYESSGTYQTVSGAINTGNIASQSVSYATISQQLTKFGDIYGQDWNSYFITGKLIVSNALGHTGANRPINSYGYGTTLSYGETGGPLMQIYLPEDAGNTGGSYRALAFRSGYNGSWSNWKTVVDQVGNTCTVAGSNGTGLQVHSNVSYNQNPLTYFLLRGQADSSWKTFKILLTGDAGGQDIEFRRIAENSTDARMFYVPRGLNQVIFDYTVVQPSDSRLKDNLTPITTPVDKIKSLRGVEFDWNSGEHVGAHDVGLIAQDVEAVLPEAVTTQEDGYKNLAYTKVIPLLVEAMKEQQTMIEALRAEIELLKNK